MSEDYNSTLLTISGGLDEDNLSALKFLFQDHIHKAKLSRIKEGFDFFTLLVEKKLICQGDSSLLREALKKIGRSDLASKLKTCTSPKVLSTYRLLLYDIAADMYPKDISSAIFLFRIPKGKGDKVANAYDLLSLLEQMEVYSEEDTSRLQNCLKDLHRNDLASKLSIFHADQFVRKREYTDLTSTDDMEMDVPAVASRVKPPNRPTPIKDVRQAQRKSTTEASDLDVDSPAGKPKTSKISKMFEGCLGKKTPDKEHLADTKLLLDAGQSVGLIGRNGTGFVVGRSCIMTTAHVFKEALMIQDDVIERCQSSTDYLQCVQDRLQQFELNITFTLGSQPRTFRLIHVKCIDIETDTAIVEVEGNSEYPLPAPFTRFLDVPDDKFGFDLLGHDDGEWNISRDRNCYTITRREDFKRMKAKLEALAVDDHHLSVYDGFGRRSYFVEFHCSMKNGASGSPGVVVRNGEVLVFTMLRAGFPENPKKIPIPEELCVEQGVRMSAIRDRIYAVDEELCGQIFQS